jgi:hypothetical protein
MEKTVSTLNPDCIEVVKHEACTSIEHLAEWMDKITADDGEGVMLRDPES